MAVIKLLIHAPTPEALMRAQNNARNLLKLEASAVVEIVVNGAAVGAAIGIIDESILPLLVLCRNSLQGQQLEPPAGVRVVAAAVQYLAQQQALGWSYIRA
ncbi:MAG: intracellular sulfur oxidation DsrE/DsrF family protein [Cellvibrionaceae bacterium]|jgi:intracellular sulfur oxidation DsrE/DsrF family protein